MEPTTAPAAENKIDKLSSSVGVTSDGVEWMKSALDPFPDEPRKCSGYPDSVSGPSVVQKLKYQVVITTPTPLLGGTWDANIYFDGFDNNAALYLTGFEGAPDYLVQYTAQVALGKNAGGLVVRTGLAGSTLGVTTIAANLPIPNSYYLNGKTRVIAKAFEVHNTTPPLYKGGALSTYRSPTKCTVRAATIAKDLNVPGGISNVTTALIDYSIPEVVTEVMNLEDTEVFEAEEGCYCVATLSEPTIESIDFKGAVTPLIIDSSGLLYSTLYTPNPSGNSYQAAQVFPGKFNLSGAFFTGLSQQTTLTVVVHYLLERFVTEDNLDLVVMTTKSPSFDPAALELYSRAAAALPTGIPVKDNADGDWIKNVCDVLSNFGVPGMPLVKGAVDLWNGVKLNPNKNQITSEEKRVRAMENKINKMINRDSRVVEKQPLRQQQQQPRQPRTRNRQKAKAQSGSPVSKKEMAEFNAWMNQRKKMNNNM